MKKIITCVICLSLVAFTYTQEFGLGGGLVINASESSIGLNIRGEIPLKNYDIHLLEGLSVLPQIDLLVFGRNRKDLNIGTTAHLSFYKYNIFLLYGIAGLKYSYLLSGTGNSRLLADFGIGAKTDKCLGPFTELKIDTRGDFLFKAGAVYTFNCKRFGALPCPKMPKPVEF